MSNSLFVVTNRAFKKDRKTGNHSLLDNLNPQGAKELRLFEARPQNSDLNEWFLEIIPDRPSRKQFDESGVQPNRPKKNYFGSDLVAARLIQRLREQKRNLLLFIHGYNNTAIDAFRRAWRLAERYDIEVLVFTWPANGGGSHILEDIHGKASYKSDKSDARSSTEALDRTLARMHQLITELNEGVLANARQRAEQAHPDNPERQREFLARKLRTQVCPFNVSLIAHSMGNYLYKKMLLTSSERLSLNTVFDNVILKAADTNHEGHANWIERIRVRRRVYITINQNDSALGLSTIKIGDEQKPRLGNTLARQDAPNGTYIDFTSYIDDEHSYFYEEDLDKNQGEAKPLTGFFAKALNGEIAETGLSYHPDKNTYSLI